MLDSSNKLDIKEINQQIITAFQSRNAIDRESAVYIEDLNLSFPLKLQYYLVEEFVRNDFMEVLEDGKVFFKEKKFKFEKKKVQIIYMGILMIPFVVALLLIIL